MTLSPICLQMGWIGPWRCAARAVGVACHRSVAGQERTRPEPLSAGALDWTRLVAVRPDPTRSIPAKPVQLGHGMGEQAQETGGEHGPQPLPLHMSTAYPQKFSERTEVRYAVCQVQGTLLRRQWEGTGLLPGHCSRGVLGGHLSPSSVLAGAEPMPARLHSQRPSAKAPRRAVAASPRALSALRLRAAGVYRKAWGTPA